MPYYSVVNPPAMVNGQPEDISIVLANFEAIQQVINGLTDANIAPNAAIKWSKLEQSGTWGGITINSGNMDVPGYIRAGSDVWAWYNSNPVGMGHLGPSSEPGFRIQGDTYLYRTAAGELTTNILHATNLQDRSEKGVPNGYASLDGSGKVPASQLPPYPPADNLKYLGDYAAGAHAEGDVVVYNGVVYMCMTPTSAPPTGWPSSVVDLAPYQTRAEKGAPSGYASLDGTGKVPLAQIPTMDAAHIPDVSATYQVVSAKGQPNGYVPLDSSTKIAATYLPASATIPPGGTAGQALTKVDATNYNLVWATISGGGGTGLPADTVIASGTRIIANKLLAGDTQPSWRVFGSGQQDWGPGGTVSPDTNLYRSSAGVLKTDGTLWANFVSVTNEVKSMVGLPQQIDMANDGKLYFGSAYDTNLYRYAADTLKTDDSLVVAGAIDGDMHQYLGDWAAGSYKDGDMVVYNGITYLCVRDTSAAPTAWTVTPADLSAYQQKTEKNQPNGYVGLDASSRIVFQGDASANLYRVAAGAVKTDGQFSVARDVYVDAAGTGARLYFGSAGDTNLYRLQAATLKTDGSFVATANVQAHNGSANWTILGHNGNQNFAGIAFGSGLDTNLYRLAAGQLATDGAFYFKGADKYVAFDTGSAANNFLYASATGDAQWRFTITRDGRMNWGPGGTTAPDTSLYRRSAGELATALDFTIGAYLRYNVATAAGVTLPSVAPKRLEVHNPDGSIAGYIPVFGNV